jgi:hypothetical protein
MVDTASFGPKLCNSVCVTRGFEITTALVSKSAGLTYLGMWLLFRFLNGIFDLVCFGEMCVLSSFSVLTARRQFHFSYVLYSA